MVRKNHSNSQETINLDTGVPPNTAALGTSEKTAVLEKQQ